MSIARRIVLFLQLASLAVLPVACSTPGETVVTDSSVDVKETLTEPDLGTEEAVTTDLVVDSASPPEEVFEAWVDETVDPCEGEGGCFLDPCTTNGDCQSGWCVEHMGDGVCSQACQEECPPGWTCSQVTGTGPDVAYICVSGFANLCKPCQAGADCASEGDQDDVCVDYGDEGSFCGGTCVADGDCPWGFSCASTVTVDGISTAQCVADAGVCPCTPRSVELALWTPCESISDAGTCEGKRICQEGGLSDCNAAVATAETCNGLDDDCDGDVDEPDSVGGDFINLCEDGNDCTKDVCAGVAGCQTTALDEGECKDGDPCTVADHCELGVCVGDPAQCDDGNPCTDNVCQADGGCAFEPNAESCDDGDACTVGDLCHDGTCAGVQFPCECYEDSDCDILEDGDLCNGHLFCDTSSLPHLCEVVPDSPVVCPAASGSNEICLVADCNPATGACGFAPAHEGFACDDNDACTVGDHCVAGECAPGLPADCGDGNGCTTDGCSPGEGCTHTPAALTCDDFNLCTDGDSCLAGQCQPGGAVDCDDGNPCTIDSCAPKSGCLHSLSNGSCDDGDACTVNDHCQAGQCLPGPTLECNDFNPCTDDSCGAGGCQHLAHEGGCDDGNACTLGESCAAGACVSAGLLDCDDDDICTTDFCDPQTGCGHKLNQAPCDDGDVCTTGDHCSLGECISSGSLSCNDGNLCTDDVCHPESGCVFQPNEAPCDDGEVCTLADACSEGLCKAGGWESCDDGNPCTDDSCQSGVGCLFVPNTLPCNDNDACTKNEFCAGSTCGGGSAINCDDGNICTDDSCHVVTGCVNQANEADCNDQDACTVTDKCLDKACHGSGALACDDGKVCTDDSCGPETGCIATPVQDDTACGQDLVCKAGECVQACQPGSATFEYTGAVQSFTVPSCGGTLQVTAYGAQGGDSFNHNMSKGGKGGSVQATLTVAPGGTLQIFVGEKPIHMAGGYNGGGDGKVDPAQNTWLGAGGGGATDIRLGGAALSDRILVAAGGGGACPNTPTDHGGVGGGLTGGSGGSNSSGSEGKGGTPSAGGAGGQRSGYQNASPGALGLGGPAGGNTAGGGGGAGYFGGGGGSWGGGGGGSSWVKPDISGNLTHNSGVRTGHGQITLSW